MLRPITSLGLLLIAGCSFGFTGGGLDKSIRTVAVTDFTNNTADPGIAQQARVAVKQAVESRLGLRPATEALADALVRGTVVRYDPDQPIAFNGSPTGVAGANQVNVTQRQVELTVDLLVVDQKTNRTLWDGRGTTVQGQYSPGRESDGRQKALDQLIKKLIDGVHSNW
jgi:lipopolysaccharide assembly LptE-like protein